MVNILTQSACEKDIQSLHVGTSVTEVPRSFNLSASSKKDRQSPFLDTGEACNIKNSCREETEQSTHEIMMRHYVRFLLVIVVVVSFGSNHELSKHNDIQEDSETIGWIWLPENATMEAPASYIEDNEVTEMKNVSKLWERLNAVNKSTKYKKPKASNGTNWCGRLGNPIADIDFSKYRRTNACCKIHLQSMSIDITGNVGYKCSTDIQFYDCLKTVNSSMSKTVGDYYFNERQPLCYHIEQDEICEDMLCTLLMKILSKIVPKY